MSSSTQAIISRSPSETLQLGSKLATELRGGELLLLAGPMGVGKSVLARGVLLGLGAEHWRGSPTFTIVNEYDGAAPAYHVDLYRLEGEEIEQLGLEELARSDSVVLVEWPERATAYLESLAPARLIRLDMAMIGPDERLIEILRGPAPLSLESDGEGEPP